MEQFREAADSFRAGRLVECKKRLLEVQLQGFSRLQWYRECNLLTCRFQELLQRRGRRSEGEDILLGYERLWQRMTGVAPSCSSVGMELAVVLSLCQLHTILRRWSQLRPLISTTTDRITQVTQPSSSVSLNTIDVKCFGVCAVRCVEKIRVLLNVAEAGETKSEENFSNAIDAHSHWLNGNQAEASYRKAWMLYRNGDYKSSLEALSTSSLLPPPSTLSPLVHLLLGACHSQQAHPNLALLHWKNVMEMDGILNHTPFLASLQNSALTYTQTGNTMAAIATRRLEMKALGFKSDSSVISLPVWVWLHNEVDGVHRPPSLAMFCLAWQLARGQRYEEASQTLQECLSLVEEGAVLCNGSLSLPPPSSLHLLHALCEVAGQGEGVRKGRKLCLELLQSSPSDDSIWRSKVMCVLATAALYFGECSESKDWGARLLGEVEKMIYEVKDKRTSQQLHQLKVHSQLVLALVAIGNSHWREALKLLACVVPATTGLYNHCLLQCKVGVVLGGTSGWLERRGGTPTGRSDARERLRHAQQQLNTLTGRERNYAAMDIAMLKIWLQHNR